MSDRAPPSPTPERRYPGPVPAELERLELLRSVPVVEHALDRNRPGVAVASQLPATATASSGRWGRPLCPAGFRRNFHRCKVLFGSAVGSDAVSIAVRLCLYARRRDRRDEGRHGRSVLEALDFIISEVTMPEYFLIVDHSELAKIAAQVLRAAWPRVDVADSAEIARARIAMLDEHRDDLVVIVDADLLDGALDLSRLLASRQNTIVMLALNDLANDRRAANQGFVVGKPYGDTLLDQTEDVVSRLRMKRILVHVVSILMMQTDSPGAWSAAGSGCLVQLPERAVILTAGHVVERMQHEGTKTYIGGNGTPVDISSWPVLGIDNRVDIATIGIPEGFDPQVIGSRFYVPSDWPPTRAQPGNGVILVGFPSAHRISVDGMSMSHGALFSDFVSSSSTLQFVTAPKDMDRKGLSMTERFDSIDDTGGMSGCPMFVGGQGEKPQLRGVLKEGGSGPNAVLFGAHADFVRTDGTIDHSLMR